MHELEPVLRGLRRRVAAVLALRALLRDEALWCVAFGIGALILRVLGGPSRLALILGIGGAAIVAVFALGRARRQTPDRRALLALIDARAHCGGLAAAANDIDLGAWSPTIKQVPRIDWSPRKPLAILALAAAFAVAALLVPATSAASHHRLDIGSDVKRIEAKLDTLKQEQAMPADRADALRETLERLRATAEGDDPAKAWETLDAIDETAMKAAASAGEEAVRNGERLGTIEALSAAAESGDAQAAQDLAEEAARTATENAALLPGVSASALSKSGLTQQQLRELANAARLGKSALRNKLAKLGAGGMLDPKMLRKFDEASSGNAQEQLARYLRQRRGESDEPNGRPGSGGRDRGRADAPLFFGEQTKNGDERFKDHALPPASAAALQDSDLAGISMASPGDAHAVASRGGALDVRAGAGSAHTGVVLPRHRGTVARFFERSPK
jgi:hypothetical protein